MSQAELAEMCGVSAPTICRIEKRHMIGRPETLKRLARALGTSWTELVED